MMQHVFLLFFITIFSFTSNSASAAYGINSPLEQEAYDFIAAKAENSLRIVTSNQSKEAKAAQLRGFFSTQNFAWTDFSWGVLGRAAREISKGRKFNKESDNAVFKEYTELMAKYFAGLYAKHLAQYDASTFEVRNVIDRSNNRRRKVTVKTKISEKGIGGRDEEDNPPNAVDIDFILCDAEGGTLKVCNAVVMGFDLKGTFRDEHNRWFYNEANWSLQEMVDIFRRDVNNL